MDIVEKYLTEGKYKFADVTDDKLKRILIKIQKDCSQALEAYEKSNACVYRGAHEDQPGEFASNDLMKKQSRKNRKPKDTTMFITKMLDKKFQEKFGWRPRTQGVFATSNKRDAGNYGRAFLFFPFDDFEFLWSPNIRDLYWSLGSYADATASEIGFGYEIKEINSKLDDVVNSYKNNYLPRAIHARNEIMFNCEYYYLVNPSLYHINEKGKKIYLDEYIAEKMK